MKRSLLSPEFLDRCNKRFKSDPTNIITRNAVTSVGAILTTTDSNLVNKVNHVFMNSVKKKNLKATNQGSSGRCWIYGALACFRHSIINGMNLENFEFSESYLFFYDKLEMANTFLRWIIEHPGSKPGDRDFDYTLSNSQQDGGWWNCFANLVTKYGVVPKDAMKETYHSGDSGDMNQIISERLHGAANWICNNRDKDLDGKLTEVMELVYKDLVLFLGEPPKEFDWSFTDDENEAHILTGLTPHLFKDMVLPGVDMLDFVSLANIPVKSLEFNTRYSITQTNNVYEGELCTVLNLPIKELAKYAKKSILSGMPVWFVADVSQDFHPWFSCLDDKLIDTESVFGKMDKKFDKGSRIEFLTTQGNHAMCLTGVNIDSNGNPLSWQVENSWGYCDNETPGEDGWLTMSNSWFEKNVTEVVIHKNYLSRTIGRHLKKTPIKMNPWDCMAPALKAGCVDAPREWQKRVNRS